MLNTKKFALLCALLVTNITFGACPRGCGTIGIVSAAMLAAFLANKPFDPPVTESKPLDPQVTKSKLPPLLDCPFKIPSCDEIQNAASEVPSFNILEDDLFIAEQKQTGPKSDGNECRDRYNWSSLSVGGYPSSILNLDRRNETDLQEKYIPIEIPRALVIFNYHVLSAVDMELLCQKYPTKLIVVYSCQCNIFALSFSSSVLEFVPTALSYKMIESLRSFNSLLAFYSARIWSHDGLILINRLNRDNTTRIDILPGSDDGCAPNHSFYINVLPKKNPKPSFDI